MKLFSTIKCKARKIMCGAAAAVSCLALSVAASAEETTGTTTDLSTYSAQIVDQFTGAADDIMPIITGVLGAGLAIFVVFLGIKFGKKMFKTVSNG